MSKIYKATIYIDDINDTFKNINEINEYLNERIDITVDFDDYLEIDTTDYLEKVEDNYSWNTVDSSKRIREMQKFIDNGGYKNE